MKKLKINCTWKIARNLQTFYSIVFRISQSLEDWHSRYNQIFDYDTLNIFQRRKAEWKETFNFCGKIISFILK